MKLHTISITTIIKYIMCAGEQLLSPAALCCLKLVPWESNRRVSAGPDVLDEEEGFSSSTVMS